MAASKDGQAMIEVLRSASRLLKEIGTLLQSADPMMLTSGWKPYSNKAKVVSESVQSAADWVPNCAFRYYKNESKAERIAFISVLLAPYEEPDPTFSEPLVSAGAFQCEKGQHLEWSYDVARWHVSVPGWKSDGSISRINPQEQWRVNELDGCTATRMVSFALPLTHVTDDELLEGRVVRRLLAELSS